MADHLCAHCGDRFAPTRADALTCSARCRDAAYRARKTAREAVYAARLEDLLERLTALATPKETTS